MRFRSGVVALSLCGSACTMVERRRDADLREVGLFVPSAVASEPRADRVIVLLQDGRTTVMEDAVLRRNGNVLRLEKAESPTMGEDFAVSDVAAVEIERRASGPTAELLGERTPRASTIGGSAGDVIGGVLIGVLVTGLGALVLFSTQ